MSKGSTTGPESAQDGRERPKVTLQVSDRVRTVAIAGYLAYHQGRTARPWDTLPIAEVFRWCLAADALVRCPLITVDQVRAMYHLGRPETGLEDLAPATANRWRWAYYAMVQVGAQQPQERKVVA